MSHLKEDSNTFHMTSNTLILGSSYGRTSTSPIHTRPGLLLEFFMINLFDIGLTRSGNMSDFKKVLSSELLMLKYTTIERACAFITNLTHNCRSEWRQNA